MAKPGLVNRPRSVTFASTIQMAGRSETAVAELCGHKDWSITRRVYAHWLASDHDPTARASLLDIARDALTALGEAVSHAVRKQMEPNRPRSEAQVAEK